MENYIAAIHSPESGSPTWGVTFPDVPGCVTVGDTFEEAVANAREALSGHLAALAADGDPIPQARSYAELQEDPEASEELDGAVVQMIYPRQVAAERVRVNISIDKGLLRRADEAAEARGLTRSGLIEEALDKLIEA